MGALRVVRVQRSSVTSTVTNYPIPEIASASLVSTKMMPRHADQGLPFAKKLLCGGEVAAIMFQNLEFHE